MTPRASARGKVSLAIENRPPLLHRHAVLAGLCIGDARCCATNRGLKRYSSAGDNAIDTLVSGKWTRTRGPHLK